MGSSLKVHAGDFLETKGKIYIDSFCLKTKDHPLLGETIPITEIEIIEVADEASVKKIGGTVGWGLAGTIVLGPVGLLAGLLLGGKGKSITFVAKFKDGRRLLATTDSKTFLKLQKLLF